MKLYQDKDWLCQKYWDEKLSMHKIGKLYKFSDSTIYRWLKKHGIKTRSQSETNKENWKNPEYRKNQIKKRKEAAKTPKIKKHLSRMSRNMWGNPQKRKNMLSQRIPYKRTEEHKRKMSEVLIGRVFSEMHIKHISIAQKKRMQNPQEKKRMQEIRLIATKRKPTSPEKLFDEITPFFIQYTGNKTWWKKLSNGKYKNPDFKVSGQNKVIEIFGDYWHRNDDPQELIDLYKQAGLDCLVIWESEIYNQPNNILERVNKFIRTEDSYVSL